MSCSLRTSGQLQDHLLFQHVISFLLVEQNHFARKHEIHCQKSQQQGYRKGRDRPQGLMQYSKLSNPGCDELILMPGQYITACGRWPCPFPQSYNSEIRHPTPVSSINSSHMDIQFKIPLLLSILHGLQQSTHILQLPSVSSKPLSSAAFPQKLLFPLPVF